MTEFKTIKQIANELGDKFPFEIVNECGVISTVVGISPKHTAVGWYKSGDAVMFSVFNQDWKLVEPKRKMTEYAYDGGHKRPGIGWEYGGEVEARKQCESVGVKFLRVLREIDIDD